MCCVNWKHFLSVALISTLWICQCKTDDNASDEYTPSGSMDSGGNASSEDADGNTNPDAGDTVIFANVSEIAVTGQEDNYAFSVTIESTDVDCTQYADWWEVLSDTGDLIFRRILTHSHTDENGTGNPFTRDGSPVTVGSSQIVIVRAHMNNVGYAGISMRGSVADGFAEAPDIGPEYAAEVERSAPQPEACLF